MKESFARPSPSPLCPITRPSENRSIAGHGLLSLALLCSSLPASVGFCLHPTGHGFDSTLSAERPRSAYFSSPLLEYGYRPAVEEYENKTLTEKPLLLYLPGFDGTFLSPFLQFPELHTIFDIRCMTVPMDDRSTVDELKETVVDYIQREKLKRPCFLAGESFGGVLACLVAAERAASKEISGLVLVNPATCYDRSRLAAEGTPVAYMNNYLYNFGLIKLLPLFTDSFSLDQLLLILQAKALPSVIDNETREAFMGRVAFSLPFVLPYMSQETLQWRLSKWLEQGCTMVDLSRITTHTLLVVGECDRTLPSIAEAERLSSRLRSCDVHVVPGAGHASTCGSRVDLSALVRKSFPKLANKKGRTSMKPSAQNGGVLLGMEPRYDNATIGLSPLKYWNRRYYLKWKETKQ